MKGLWIIPALTGWLGVAAVAVNRVSVVADASGVRINNGLRTRDLAWERIHDFRVVDRVGYAGIYVVVDEYDLVRLPMADLGGFGRAERREAVDRLRACARLHKGSA
jgi:hypothetical protein